MKGGRCKEEGRGTERKGGNIRREERSKKDMEQGEEARNGERIAFEQNEKTWHFVNETISNIL